MSPSYGSCSSEQDALSLSPAKQLPDTASSRSARLCLSLNFLGCLVLGPVNFVVYKIMYDSFGEGRAFFVSQGVNFLYVLYGGAILWLLDARGEISPDMRQIPQHKFLIMGSLDSLGGFMAAMGAVHTNGSLQQLLNQTLIPITMLLSWAFLGRGSSVYQVAGAFIILLGAWVVLLPSSSSSSDPEADDAGLVFMSNMLYMGSNIPIALSCVYKEMGFRHMHVHVIYLTQMVSIYQLIIGFALGLLQVFPGVGSVEGSSIPEIATQFVSGLECYLFLDAECRDHYTFFLLTGYCVLNFLFNITGLYLVKHDSAVLSTVTNALVLPLTCLAFTLPVLGHYREPFDSVTVFGLCVVLVGFAIWRGSSLTWVETAAATSSQSYSPVALDIDRLQQHRRRYEEEEVAAGKSSSMSCYGYTPIDGRHRSRSDSFDSTFSAPDAFYDRVIVLSLNNVD